jgi:tetratricopeptide (TPR) repeat protein
MRGTVRWLQGDDENGILDCDSSIAIDANNHLAFYHRALMKHGQHNHLSAYPDIQRAIELNPLDAEYHYIKSKIEVLYSNDTEKALNSINKALSLTRGESHIFIQRARIYAIMGDYERAIADLSWCLTLESRLNPETHFLLGDTYSLQGEFQKAIINFDKAIHLDGNVSKYYFKRGEAYERINKREMALYNYSQSIRLKPEYGYYWFRRSYLKRSMDLFDEALSDIDECLQRDSLFARGYFERAVIKQNLHDTIGSIQDYTIAISLEPRECLHYIYRGRLIALTEGYDAAQSDFATARLINPDNNSVIHSLAKAKYDLGQYKDAIEDLRTVIDLNPNNGLAYYHLAQCLVAINSMNEVCEILEKALSSGVHVAADLHVEHCD